MTDSRRLPAPMGGRHRRASPPCPIAEAYQCYQRALIDPNYLHWYPGDVVDEPSQLMPAIAAAQARHPLYQARQEEVAASLGGAARWRVPNEPPAPLFGFYGGEHRVPVYRGAVPVLSRCGGGIRDWPDGECPCDDLL